jgi:GMP synthase-like glutamine amidotransferase
MNYLIINHWHNREKGIVESLRAVDLNANYTVINVFINEQFSNKPDIDTFDAIFLSGGKPCISQAEQYPWMKDELKWLRQPYLQTIPLFAFCLGHHIVAKSLGGEVKQDKGCEEINWTMVNRIENDSLFLFGIPHQFISFQFHRDSVAKKPAQAKNLAVSSGCEYQVFEYEDRPWYSTQFHPEIDTESGNEIYLKMAIPHNNAGCNENERLQLFTNRLV